MQDGFEKNIQKRMQDFNLEPSPQVWKEIDAALGEKKRRRFVIWWWLLPLMLAGGSIVWVYHANHKSYVPSVVNNQKEKAGAKNIDTSLRENKNEEAQEDTGTKKNNNVANSKQFAGLRHKYSSDTNKNTVTDKPEVDEKKINQTDIETGNTNKINEPSEVADNKIIEPSEVDKKNIHQNNENISTVKKNTD